MSKKRKISVQSGKAKGRRYQQEIRNLILETLNHLDPDDVRSTSMGNSGVDIQTSPKCQEDFPFACEAKNQESISIWKSLEQAENNSTDKLKPILFFKRNRSKSYTVLQTIDFFKLIKIIKFLSSGDSKNSLSNYLYNIGDIDENLQNDK